MCTWAKDPGGLNFYFYMIHVKAFKREVNNRRGFNPVLSIHFSSCPRLLFLIPLLWAHWSLETTSSVIQLHWPMPWGGTALHCCRRSNGWVFSCCYVTASVFFSHFIASRCGLRTSSVHSEYRLEFSLLQESHVASAGQEGELPYIWMGEVAESLCGKKKTLKAWFLRWKCIHGFLEAGSCCCLCESASMSSP